MDIRAFVERCREIRNGSPNAFYALVDSFCHQFEDECSRCEAEQQDDELKRQAFESSREWFNQQPKE